MTSRRSIFVWLAAVCGLFFTFVAFAQDNKSADAGSAAKRAGDFPSQLIGKWEGEGKSFGATSRPEMRWEETLDGKFVHLWYRNEWNAPDGKKQVFEGHAYYQATGAGKYKRSRS